MANKFTLQPFPTATAPVGLEPENIKDGVVIGGVEGTYTEDANAKAGEILSGKTAYVQGEKVTGTILSVAPSLTELKPSSTISPSIQARMYTDHVIRVPAEPNMIAENIRANVDIYDTHGTFTEDATATASEILQGITAYANGQKVTGVVARKAAETYTPTTTNQIIDKAVYLEGEQTILGDSNLVAGNIKKGVSIFGVEGVVDADGINTDDATATAGDILQGETAYAKGEKLTGTMPKQVGKRYTPTKGGQVIPAGYYSAETGEESSIVGDANFIAANIKNGVTIWNVEGTYEGEEAPPDPNAIPGNIKMGVTIDGVQGTFTADADATAGQILTGKTAYVKGEKVVGTIPLKEQQTYTPGTANQVITSGQYLQGAQTVLGDANLKAENIKTGVSIFGVAGALAGGTQTKSAAVYLPPNGQQTLTADFTIKCVIYLSKINLCSAFFNGSTTSSIATEMSLNRINETSVTLTNRGSGYPTDGKYILLSETV